MSAAVDMFCEHLKSKGRRSGTIETVSYRLKGLLRTTDPNRVLGALTPAAVRSLWSQRCGEVGGETQRGELASAHAFAAWCIKQGWLRSDPFDGLEPSAPRSSGKPQLRISEARRFADVAIGEGSKQGLAAAIAILMGLRASEVTNRVVRDVDDGARVLWIERAKTKAGDRHLEVPEVMRAPLTALAAGRNGGELLFGINERGAACDRHWVAYHVRRICKAAGVPIVSPHGLRGTFSSIAAEATTVDHVARALGHAGSAITRRHYIGEGSEHIGRQRAALRVLSGGAA